MDGLTFYQMAARCIAVLYAMSGKNPHLKMTKDAFFRRCNELKVFEMNDDQFNRFKEENIDVIEMAKQGDVWPKLH